MQNNRKEQIETKLKDYSDEGLNSIYILLLTFNEAQLKKMAELISKPANKTLFLNFLKSQ